MHRNFGLFITVLLFSSCEPSVPKGMAPDPYFDLKGYIEKEVNRLQQINPTVDKTVTVNNQSERKELKIANWTDELAVFSDADINKSAWQGLFEVTKNDSLETYRSNDDKVFVKLLQVERKNKEVTGITILLRTKNYLYQSTDTLSYYPDSSYEIRKQQHIKLLNPKQYRISGKL
ncbi:hypothetical protein [Pedobacter sp.]|uniref:hypothetical protein n=1 Tax=Pedobacter sp. TaxID=1411316 RepID=UPI003D7F46E9